MRDNMDNRNDQLDNTIKLVYEILSKKKDNPKVKDAYEEISRLLEKRKIDL